MSVGVYLSLAEAARKETNADGVGIVPPGVVREGNVTSHTAGGPGAGGAGCDSFFCHIPGAFSVRPSSLIGIAHRRRNWTVPGTSSTDGSERRVRARGGPWRRCCRQAEFHSLLPAPPLAVLLGPPHLLPPWTGAEVDGLRLRLFTQCGELVLVLHEADGFFSFFVDADCRVDVGVDVRLDTPFVQTNVNKGIEVDCPGHETENVHQFDQTGEQRSHDHECANLEHEVGHRGVHGAGRHRRRLDERNPGTVPCSCAAEKIARRKNGRPRGSVLMAYRKK